MESEAMTRPSMKWLSSANSVKIPSIETYLFEKEYLSTYLPDVSLYIFSFFLFIFMF